MTIESVELVTTEVGELTYRSKLGAWFDRAGVRVKPRRMLAGEEEMGRTYFPVDLVPIAGHRIVRELGEEAIRRVLVQRLYAYLQFTAELEHDVVNRVTLQIAQQRLGAQLPPEMVFDAYKIYTDEGYHALFSMDLVRQVAAFTAIEPAPVEAAQCMLRMGSLLREVPDEQQSLARVFFAIISETLISAILSDIPKDEGVVTAVRLLVADHAEDEWRHHAYFSQLLELLWPQLSPVQRRVIGPLLPLIIITILEPDHSALEHELGRCGLAPAQVAEIVRDCHPRSRVMATIRESARATLSHLERNGVLSDPRTLDAFQRSGILLA